MKYPAYPSYNPSGVEWLGEVPEHWEVKGLRYVCRFAYGDALAAENREDGEIPVYGSNGMVGTHISANTRKPALIIGRKGSHGKVNYSECAAFAIDTAYFIDERHTANNLRWLFYLLGTVGLDAVTNDSAVPGLAREDAYSHFVATPPADEQRTIADFLDRQTATLDTLIAKKRALIERLKAKRTALISRTVTCGLPPEAARAAGFDPQPKMKDSGIEWLGEIPEHWEATRLKFVVLSIEQGWSPDCHSYAADENQWGVLKAGCCNNGWFRPDENKALPSELEPLADLEIQPGDILMSRANGSEELIGSAALVPSVCRSRLLLSDKTYRIRTNTGKAIPDYLTYLLQSSLGRFQIKQVISGASGLAKNIAQSDVKNFLFPLPTTQEQHAIAAYLDRETAKLDALAAKVEQAIKRLQDYRTALITAAVAGKIDVRGWQEKREAA